MLVPPTLAAPGRSLLAPAAITSFTQKHKSGSSELVICDMGSSLAHVSRAPHTGSSPAGGHPCRQRGLLAATALGHKGSAGAEDSLLLLGVRVLGCFSKSGTASNRDREGDKVTTMSKWGRSDCCRQKCPGCG